MGNPLLNENSGKPHAKPKCGAKTKAGTPCTKSAGWRTEHPGTGRCYLHGGASSGRPLETGEYSRYDVIRSEDAARLRRHFERDPNPLDLLPEVLELRVRVADFCNRYDDFTDAILAWHASHGEGWEQALQDWRKQYSDWSATFVEVADAAQAVREATIDSVRELPDPPAPPAPEDFAGKPRRIVDILSVARFLGQIGDLVERINKRQIERGISLLDVSDLLKRHGIEVLAGINETIEDDGTRRALVAAISARWDAIPLAVDRASQQSRQ